MENKQKICQTCFKSKNINLFKFNSNGYQLNKCDDCQKEYQIEYQARYKLANKELISQKAKDKRTRNRILGITKTYNVAKNKTNTHTCSVRGCYEEIVEYKGVIDCCKSHAFDKLNN